MYKIRNKMTKLSVCVFQVLYLYTSQNRKKDKTSVQTNNKFMLLGYRGALQVYKYTELGDILFFNNNFN